MAEVHKKDAIVIKCFWNNVVDDSHDNWRNDEAYLH